MALRTPRRVHGGLVAQQPPPQQQYAAAEMCTPPVQTSLSRELKQALHERNLLTAKSRRKVCSMLDGGAGSGSTNTLNGAPPQPPAPSDADKRSQFRRQAIAEILTSERSYLGQLDVLMQFFVRPLRERTDLIGAEQYQAVFGQVEMIHSLNAELLQELESDLDNVARAFKRIAPFLKLYSVYAFDYNRAQLILQELTDKNAAFRRFLEASESRPEVQRKLISLLIVPIQRVPRYRLLLQQVILYSSPSDADFRALQESVREVEATVTHLNTVIRDQEATQALLDLQNSLVQRQPNIVQPSRRVVREGVLQKMSGSGAKLRRHCVLMSDIFMYCKCLKERAPRQLVVGALQCCCIFPLKKCRVAEIFPGTLKLTCQGDGIILSADTVADGRAWLAAIKDTIDVHVQCRKTIRKGSSKRAPIRRRQEVRRFESQAEVSTMMSAEAQRRKSDFDSVVKCAADSDTDLDNTAAAGRGPACFRNIIPQRLIGRKRRRSALAAVRDRNNTSASVGGGGGSTPSKVHKPNLSSASPPRTPPIRHWFQPGVASISALAHSSHMMLTSTPEQAQNPPLLRIGTSATKRSAGAGLDVGGGGGDDMEADDPTYGMAAYAHHKSMVDKMTQELDETATTRRQQQRSGADGIDWMQLDAADVENQQQQQPMEGRTTPANKRKRVQFNVVESARTHGEMRAGQQLGQPYPFAAAMDQQQQLETPSLRSRIAGFFAGLF